MLLGLVVLADGHECLVGFLVGLLEDVSGGEGFEAVRQIFGSACDADELVLHGLDAFDDFFAFEGVSEVDDDKDEMLFVEIGGQFDVGLLLRLVLLEESALQVLKQLIHLCYRMRTLPELTNLLLK